MHKMSDGTECPGGQEDRPADFRRWVAGLVHDIKNPIFVILAGAETFRRRIVKGDPNPPREELLEEIAILQEAAQKLNATMEGLLQRFVPGRFQRDRSLEKGEEDRGGD